VSEKDTAVSSPQSIKRKQVTILILGTLTLFLIIIGGLWVSDGADGRASIEAQRNGSEPIRRDYKTDVAGQEDIWLAESEADIAELKQDRKRLVTMIELLSKQVESLANTASTQRSLPREEVSSPAFPSSSAITVPSNYQSNVAAPINSGQLNIVDQMTQNGAAKQAIRQTPINTAGLPKDNSKRLTVIDLAPVAEPVTDKGKTVDNYLPSGTFVTTTLLSGVDAPTGGQADSNPLPILLRLVDDGQMPNFFRSHVENCHITGAAVGQMSSERAFIRLEMMSCVLKDGRIIERQVKGYVTGEDGKAGLRGRVVTKQGALLARSAAAGFLQGFGSSLNNVGTVGTAVSAVTQSPSSVLQSGIAQGSGDAFSGLADYYLERADETHAIIEISAGRIGEIIFTQGVDFGTSIGDIK